MSIQAEQQHPSLLKTELFQAPVENQLTESEECIISSLFIIMGRKPFTKISIKEIADKAGVNRSTVYRNFDSKEDIIKRFAAALFSGFVATAQSRELPTFQSYVELFFRYQKRYKREFMLIHRNKLMYLVAQVAVDQYEIKVKLGTVTKQDFRRYVYHFGGVYTLVDLWCKNDMKETPEEMARVFTGYGKIRVMGADYVWAMGGFSSDEVLNAPEVRHKNDA